MKFFTFLSTLPLLLGMAALGCQEAQSQQGKGQVAVIDSARLRPDKSGKVRLPDSEWKKLLSPEAYAILREKHTERPYTGALLKNKKTGTYVCGGCGLPLFSSKTKFESGTGWPSFYDAVVKKNVKEIEDRTLGMVRTEVVCNRCDGHLGHVFEDGPEPTGLRYCINSVSLRFVETKPAAAQR